MLIKKKIKKIVPIRHIALLFLLLLTCVGGYFAYFYFDNQLTQQEDKNNATLRDLVEKSIAQRIEAKKKEPVYITLLGADKIRAIVDDYTNPDSLWAIVNKTHSIPTTYIPKPISMPNVTINTAKSNDEMSVRTDIIKPLEKMFAAAKKDGYSLMIGSGYRSAALQKIYFDSLAASVGTAAANQAIAFPGQSEHQTGLAVDISDVTRDCYLDNCFAATDDGQWLAKNSHKYGFILRYPEGKESITEYQYESWHFRYVGIDLATALYQSELTLDEAWPYLQEAQATLKSNGAI
ncbi:MAG: M15 family metallopeptidase [Candidatus Saccharimonadales bacterium]